MRKWVLGVLALLVAGLVGRVGVPFLSSYLSETYVDALRGIAGLWEIPLVLSATLVLLVLIVLPGVALRRFLPSTKENHWFAESVIGGVALIMIWGGSLVISNQFGGLRVAIPSLLLAPVGAMDLVRLARQNQMAIASAWPQTVFLLALLGPWIRLASAFGSPPGHLFQWHYWNLGVALTEVGGIPGSVMEYGLPVRWQSDYVVMNMVSEAFRALLPGHSTVVSLGLWKAPIAIAVIVLSYQVFRLWLQRTASLVGTALLASSFLLVSRLNGYKPESFGLMLALAGVLVGLSGARSKSTPRILFGVVGLALGFLSHGIAAVAVGLFGLSALTVEIISAGRSTAWWLLRWLGVGAAVLILVITSFGVALQGRPLVAEEINNPTMVGELDPTWYYLRVSVGDLDPPISAPDGFLEAVGQRNLQSSTLMGTLDLRILLGVLVLAAAVAIKSRDPATTAASLTALVFLALAGAVVLYFASFETFTPRNTGLGRLTPYSAIATCVILGSGVNAISLWIERRPRKSRRHAKFLLLIPLGLLASYSLGVVASEYVKYQGLSSEAIAALEFVRGESAPEDIVLSNATSHGLVETVTGRESPAEGRQPLIEELEFQIEVIDRLERYGAWLDNPDGVSQPFEARWVVLTTDPAALGGSATFGGDVKAFEKSSDWELVWRQGAISIFEARTINQPPVFEPFAIDITPSRIWAWLVLLGVATYIALASRSSRRAT